MVEEQRLVQKMLQSQLLQQLLYLLHVPHLPQLLHLPHLPHLPQLPGFHMMSNVIGEKMKIAIDNRLLKKTPTGSTLAVL